MSTQTLSPQFGWGYCDRVRVSKGSAQSVREVLNLLPERLLNWAQTRHRQILPRLGSRTVAEQCRSGPKNLLNTAWRVGQRGFEPCDEWRNAIVLYRLAIRRGFARSHLKCDHFNLKNNHSNSKSDRLNSKNDHSNSKSDHLNSKSDRLNSKSDHLNSKSDRADSKSDRADSKSDRSSLALKTLMAAG